MAKKPIPTEDRYLIHAEVPIDRVGYVLAALTKMGIEKIGHELVTDVHSFRDKKTNETTAAEEIEKWLSDHPTFTVREVTAHFKLLGRTGTAVYHALKKLIERKIVRKVGDNYQRADVKALAAPKKGIHKFTRYDVNNTELILRFARRHQGKCNTTQLRELFRNEGRPEGSVSPTCNAMMNDNLIKRVGDGEYKLLAKGNAKPKAKAKAKTKAVRAVNGSGVEVSAHG